MFLNFVLISSFLNYSFDTYYLKTKNSDLVTNDTMIVSNDKNDFNNISIVDFRYVLKQSDAMKKLGSKFLLLENQMNDRMKKKQLILKNEEIFINKEKNKLSDLEYKNKLDDFKNEVLKTQRKFKEERAILNKSFQKIQNDLKDLLAKVIKELSLKKNIQIVLLKENVFLFNKPSLDITNEVLHIFNDKTKALKIIISSTD